MPGDVSESHSVDQLQTKLCALCHGLLLPPPSLDPEHLGSYFIQESSDVAVLCGSCKEKQLFPRGGREGDFIDQVSSTDSTESPASSPGITFDGTRQLPLSLPDTSQSSNSPRQIDTQSLSIHAVDSDIDLSPSRDTLHPPEFPCRPYRPTPTASINNTHTTVVNVSKASYHPTSARQNDKSPLSSPISMKQPHADSKSITRRTSLVASESVSSAITFENEIQRRRSATSHVPRPMVDISRLRVPCQSYGCLYPGAIFQGTQKSGRNSYDVEVTIVDVDFSSSFLCGYLRISGLTDDWPEMTTYFDAQIIGSRYGFLTQEWGATEQEDMVHWARFPAFQQVKNELKEPRLTLDDRERGAVFMRWKERFLVPDHRVEDIIGASFAGFYYVCVDFNPPRTQPAQVHSPTRLVPPEMPACPETAVLESTTFSPSSPTSSIHDIDIPVRIRRRSTSRQRNRRLPSPARPHVFEEPVATMCGYYYHQNSEPYQQLTLSHVKKETSSSFEFR